MCIIIDANFAADVFNNSAKSDCAPIIDWLFNPQKKGVMVYGGRLADELLNIGSARRSIRVLRQAGRAVYIEDNRIDSKEEQIIQLGICESDDPHIIALACVSGARTLCSHDGDLHNDFKNKKLIDKPRGCIYQNSGHSKLLRHTSGCRQPK